MKNFKLIFSLFALIAGALLLSTGVNAETILGTSMAFGPAAYFDQYAQNNFSSFEGDNFYTGQGDHFLDFGGPSENFATEKNAGRMFIMTITNTYTTTKNVTLIPGYTWVPGATDATKIWAFDGTMVTDGTSTVSGSGSPKTIKEFLSFIAKNPTSVAGLRISSNNSEAQIQQQIVVRDLSPFKDLESKPINGGAYVSEQDNRTTMVTIPTPGLIVGPETELVIPIVAQSICTITFFCGGVLSTSSALKAKRAEATRTIATVGLQNLNAVNMARPALGLASIPRSMDPSLSLGGR